MRFSSSVFAGLMAATVFVAPALADMVQIAADQSSSTEGLGNFSGSISYEFDVFDGGLLTIELTNTSPGANGGFLTGFVFNINSVDPGAMAVLTSSPDFPSFLNTGVESAPPLGSYDA